MKHHRGSYQAQPNIQNPQKKLENERSPNLWDSGRRVGINLSIAH